MKDSGVYYVVLRGAGRLPIFDDDEDRHHFTRSVEEAALACGIKVHAYCWLVTEARLAIETGGVPIAQFSERIADSHARRRAKRRISLTGSHFEQKYREVPVDGQTELPGLVRHIHLAPLKAGLTDDLAGYPWSSHRVYLGLESAPWLTTEEMVRHFAGEPDPARAYREFIEGDPARPRSQTGPVPVRNADAADEELRKK
jgi:REP-associated tyrosine transposase